ncbi:hypothetical protein HYPSUDRAFT_214138 [Hypholoma sublateritium FD-334 SS-4]|uniref:Fungal lipase-type domain-containing protein n=1 Tax=Hypholoma sublateritium (strain FD-334 SS-4) TaxID=945553 RepID=A0A0D2P2D4_HYPSF|nr:hypothetical protein HYPSUDRAFT_214138 [Hypholoma sublateritium FD-334 SS-4]
MTFPATLSVKDDHKLPPSSISGDLYGDLVYYFKYATSAYSPVCPRPNGNSLVIEISNPLTDIQGFIARDKTRKEIVVALRGSASVADVLMDASIVLVPFVSPGVQLPPESRVHSGFLVAWDSISPEVLLAVGSQLATNEDHAVVTTGHSLGGSLALLAAVSLQQNFKNAQIRTYSYGAPRSGNKIFSDYVNAKFGDNACRVVHGNDGVPTAIPIELGYHHHGVEYWQHTSPPSNETTLKCDPEGEDPNGSASIPSQGVNLAHATYFGILVGTPFCL